MLNLPIRLPQKKAFSIETNDVAFPRLHMLSVAAGQRGSGKSVAVSSLCNRAMNRQYFDRVLLISPTYASNREIWDMAKIRQEDVLEPSMTCVQEVKDIIKAEKDEWDAYEEKKQKWDRYQKLLASDTFSFSGKNLEELLFFETMGFLDGPPKAKYGHKPRLCLIIDDAMGTDLMRGGGAKSGLVKLCIAHRHWSEIGISIIMCVQSWCARTGIDRSLREQLTNVMLWKICQEPLLQKAWSENDIDLPYENFKAMCDYVWSVPHRFLFIDFSPKSPELKYRMNFDTPLDPKQFS